DRAAGTIACLGVHDAEAAHRAAVGRTPGREVVLLWRLRPGMLRLLGPGDEGVRARRNPAAPHHLRDAGQLASAPGTGQPAQARRPRVLRQWSRGTGAPPWHLRRSVSRHPRWLASPVTLVASHDVFPGQMR